MKLKPASIPARSTSRPRLIATRWGGFLALGDGGIAVEEVMQILELAVEGTGARQERCLRGRCFEQGFPHMIKAILGFAQALSRKWSADSNMTHTDSSGRRRGPSAAS